MNSQNILDEINKQIVEERGTPITGGGMFTDSGLDSLGSTIVLLTLDANFNLAKDLPDDQLFEFLDIPNLTVKRLVHLCKS